MIDISVFKTEKFFIDSDTKLICPDCNIGHLISNQKNIQIIEYKKYNNDIFALYDYESEWLKFAFVGFLECNNNHCNEKIAVSGRLVVNYGYYESQYIPDEYITVDEKICYPEYFARTPRIIEIDDKYPSEIRDILSSAFSLFWLDKNACVNRLRSCIENILDSFGVPKRQRTKKGLRPFSLHNRIERFCKKNDKYKKILTAVKWIGNVGSHSDDVKVKNILDGFRLIDYMLKELYINEEKEILKLSKKYNKTKGK